MTSSNPSRTPSRPGDVTLLLRAMEQGKSNSDELLAVVYDELRQLAAARMRQEAAAHTLQPTALVHEAYLRLVGNAEVQWDSRGHFFAAAAESMRRILIESARRKQRLKHGGKLQRIELDPGVAAVECADYETLLAIDEALTEFAQLSPEKAKLVKLRYFAGVTEGDAANILNISRPTAARWWAYSRAWLYDRLRNTSFAPDLR